MSVFATALEEMDRFGLDVWVPGSFKHYSEQVGETGLRTPQFISVDSIDRLSPLLRESMIMIFRLGSRAGSSSTHFGLARCRHDWNEYFLIDKDLCTSALPEVFLPAVSARRLFSFKLLPKLTETSAVNLAIGSGLLQYALELDDSLDYCVPATGQSTFTFDFKPRKDLSDVFSHEKGQVEIDALFMGRRRGREQLFLVEAKTGKPEGSLAKHKLCYPVAALRNSVPKYIQIVPVYMKSWSESDGRHFLITECQLISEGVISISELEPIRTYHGVLIGFND